MGIVLGCLLVAPCWLASGECQQIQWCKGCSANAHLLGLFSLCAGVSLASHVCCSQCSSQAMMRPCYSAILNHAAGGKPAIVFVPTRKHVRLTALDLLTSAAADGDQHRWGAACMMRTECAVELVLFELVHTCSARLQSVTTRHHRPAMVHTQARALTQGYTCVVGARHEGISHACCGVYNLNPCPCT